MEFERRRVDTREEQRVVIVEEVTGVEPEPVPYSRSGKRWQPTTLVVTCERERSDGGPWGPWRVHGGAVRGVNVKQDGTHGADRQSARHDFPRGHWSSRRAEAIASDLGAYGMPAPMRPGPEPVDLDG